MQSSTGQTASHTPQPQHASMLAYKVPPGITSKTESGHAIQQMLHLTQVSKSITGRIVRVETLLNDGPRSCPSHSPPSPGAPVGIGASVNATRLYHRVAFSQAHT